MVPEIPKNDIFIIKNFLVVVTLMAYGRVSAVHAQITPHEPTKEGAGDDDDDGGRDDG